MFIRSNMLCKARRKLTVEGMKLNLEVNAISTLTIKKGKKQTILFKCARKTRFYVSL